MSAIDGWLKQNGKYQKNEAKITFNDIQDALVLVSSNFSTQTSYENQTRMGMTAWKSLSRASFTLPRAESPSTM